MVEVESGMHKFGLREKALLLYADWTHPISLDFSHFHRKEIYLTGATEGGEVGGLDTWILKHTNMLYMCFHSESWAFGFLMQLVCGKSWASDVYHHCWEAQQ